MFSGRPSVPLCVRASVRDSRGSFMFLRYLQYLLTDFRQTFVTGASRDWDELIRFWGQKVKVQGHGMTECITDFHVSTISPVSIDRFSPNFCHWCILGHRWPDYVFGSKGQSSRSHHRGGGAQHSTLPLSATFSSLSSDISWNTVDLKLKLCLQAEYGERLMHILFSARIDSRKSVKVDKFVRYMIIVHYWSDTIWFLELYRSIA